MSVYYILEIAYPDGHIEELEQNFNSKEEAKGYGENLVGQIAYTEDFKRNDDDFGFSEKQKPYYLVTQVVDGQKTIVIDSRK